MSSTTTNSNASSCEHHSVLDELHCGFRLLMYNERSRIVSGVRKTSGNSAYVEPPCCEACVGVDQCVGLGAMDNDRLEKEVRFGQAKRESNQTSAVGLRCLANGINACRIRGVSSWLKPTFLRSLRYARQ